MFEDLFILLNRLGLGAAARPLCDLVADLVGESMSLQQLEQEIRNVLQRYDRGIRASAVITALVQLGFAGLSTPHGEDHDGAPASAIAPGFSPVSDSAILSGDVATIVAEPRAKPVLQEMARGWLDIDGGIYFDVRQHGAGSDPER